MPLSDHPASPDAVINGLREHAERKAAYRMYYSAADLFREYKGPYASETAVERQRLADEYEQRGRVAEQQRRDGIPIPSTPRPPVEPRKTPTPITPRPPRPVTTSSSQPKPAGSTPAARKPIDFTPAYEVKDGFIIFNCRWCKESISFEIAKAAQITPCPKCDSLVSVPKPPSA